MSELLHNEFPPESLEGKDLAHLLHPTTNLKLHRQQGPSIHEKAEGVYLWDSKGGVVNIPSLCIHLDPNKNNKFEMN